MGKKIKVNGVLYEAVNAESPDWPEVSGWDFEIVWGANVNYTKGNIRVNFTIFNFGKPEKPQSTEVAVYYVRGDKTVFIGYSKENGTPKSIETMVKRTLKVAETEIRKFIREVRAAKMDAVYAVFGALANPPVEIYQFERPYKDMKSNIGKAFISSFR